jgi:hypothetical protein
MKRTLKSVPDEIFQMLNRRATVRRLTDWQKKRSEQANEIIHSANEVIRLWEKSLGTSFATSSRGYISFLVFELNKCFLTGTGPQLQMLSDETIRTRIQRELPQNFQIKWTKGRGVDSNRRPSYRTSRFRKSKRNSEHLPNDPKVNVQTIPKYLSHLLLRKRVSISGRLYSRSGYLPQL